MIKKLLATVLLVTALFAQTPDQQISRNRVAESITKGHVLAWARHKTGFNQDDEFESVAVIPGSDGEDELWAVVNRTINGVDYRFVEQFQPRDFGDQNDAWFVDAGIGGAGVGSGGVAEIPATVIPGTPEIAATYTMTLISQNGGIYGIPAGDGGMLAGLDVSGVAVDLGGGLVGLPYLGHPFAAGETVRITNTTSYNASEVLHASTSVNQLVITAAYSAETFDGTELVVKLIASLTAGAGRMAQDGDGNLYYGHVWSTANNTFITKVETDGTLVYDYLDMSNAPPEAKTSSQLTGLAITPDGAYIYALVEAPGPTDHGYIYKWNLSTGAEEWVTTYDAGTSAYLGWPQFNLDVDADGNSYHCTLSGNNSMTKITSDGLTMSKLTYMGSPKTAHITVSAPYVALVDDDMGIVITGTGTQFVAKGWNEGALLYNLAVRTFDDSVGDQIRLGDLYDSPSASYDSAYNVSTGHVATYDGFIYVLLHSPTPTLYKVSWDGASLAIVDSAAGPTYATGMYFDLYGNLVVVNQDWISHRDDVLYFYDTDLNELSNIDGMYTLMLSTWDAPTGGSWIQGNAVFNGVLAIPATPDTPGDALVPGVDPNYVAADHYPVDANLCVYADGIPIGNFVTEADANGTIVLNLGAEYDTVIAGINYYSVYESYMLAPKTSRVLGVKLDTYETLGIHLGTDQTYSSDIQFSEDDFATRAEMYTGWKNAAFPRGSSREPRVYLWHWEPVPATIRGLYMDMEVRQ